MNQRNIFLIHFLLIIVSYSCNRVAHGYKELNRIQINFVNPQTLTPFAIECDNFETFFKSTYKTLLIDDTVEIEKLKTCLLKSKTVQRAAGIDVRVKVYLYNSDKILSIYCFDRFENLILNNIENLKNTCFIRMINEKLN